MSEGGSEGRRDEEGREEGRKGGREEGREGGREGEREGGKMVREQKGRETRTAYPPSLSNSRSMTPCPLT